METLFLYFTLEYYLRNDSRPGNWILFGVIVRVAMRMGFHRDPAHSPQISPFHGEMRRRIWAITVQLDTILSSQVGLPRMINLTQCDTKEPCNLADEDLHETMTELPPGRPDSDFTPILYLIVRSRVLAVFGMILDTITATESVTHAEVMRLDSLLLEIVAAIPPSLRSRPIANSIGDHPDDIIRRVYLAMLVRKAQCVLHYRYLIAGRSYSSYIYSRQSCIDAAIDILQYQSMLHEETKPGGQLHEVKSKVLSIVQAEFLLATTILCVYLDHEVAASLLPRAPNQEVAEEKRDVVERTLRESDRIWSQASDQSREAQKAAAAVRVVLVKVERARLASLAMKADNSLQYPLLDWSSFTPSQGPESSFGSTSTQLHHPTMLCTSQADFAAYVGTGAQPNLFDLGDDVSQFQEVDYATLLGWGNHDAGFGQYSI